MRRVFRFLYIAFAWILSATVFAIAVSSLAERGQGETLLSFIGLRFTVTGVGAAIVFLTVALFALFWNAVIQPRKPGTRIPLSVWLNSIGFGLLPGAAVWKVFDHTTTLGYGIPVPEPFPQIAFISADKCFLPSRIEFILAIVCFVAIVCWLMIRRKDIPGNGDLILTVLCVWGLIRSCTDGLRVIPFMQAGAVNLTQIIFLIIGDVPMAVWTYRLVKKQKSTIFTVLEWIAVISCEIVIVLNTSGVISSGSGIGNLAVNAGCTILSILVILLAGKDSRD